jgi:PPOX class probable F420-dependent enzyme
LASGAQSVLSGHKYINLETFKKDGKGVVTPVWFTVDDENIFVVTRSGTGKVKRIRNNGSVRIMPSGFRGEPKGEWYDAKARFATEEELKKALDLRSKKYGFRAKIAGAFSSGKGDPVAIVIKPTSPP